MKDKVKEVLRSLKDDNNVEVLICSRLAIIILKKTVTPLSVGMNE